MRMQTGFQSSIHNFLDNSRLTFERCNEWKVLNAFWMKKFLSSFRNPKNVCFGSIMKSRWIKRKSKFENRFLPFAWKLKLSEIRPKPRHKWLTNKNTKQRRNDLCCLAIHLVRYLWLVCLFVVWRFSYSTKSPYFMSNRIIYHGFVIELLLLPHILIIMSIWCPFSFLCFNMVQ